MNVHCGGEEGNEGYLLERPIICPIAITDASNVSKLSTTASDSRDDLHIWQVSPERSPFVGTDWRRRPT
jgi:hypothetical protein